MDRLILLLNHLSCVITELVENRHMAQTLRKGLRSSNQAKRAGSNEFTAKNQDIARWFDWEFAAIYVHLPEICYLWAKTLGITPPPWLLLIAYTALDLC